MTDLALDFYVYFVLPGMIYFVMDACLLLLC